MSLPFENDDDFTYASYLRIGDLLSLQFHDGHLAVRAEDAAKGSPEPARKPKRPKPDDDRQSSLF